MHYRLWEVAQGVAIQRAALAPPINERSRRLTAVKEARAIGSGGITLVSQIHGLS